MTLSSNVEPLFSNLNCSVHGVLAAPINSVSDSVFAVFPAYLVKGAVCCVWNFLGEKVENEKESRF